LAPSKRAKVEGLARMQVSWHSCRQTPLAGQGFVLTCG
jgi:hypothetical protein